MKLEVFEPDDLMDAAAEAFAVAIRASIDARGSCAFALSRPQEGLLRGLVAHELDWSAIDVFQVDERVAPDGHPDRNLTLIEGGLPREAKLHPMPVADADLEAAAARYAAKLESMCGSPPVLDVVHLGLGPDGHTASLLPGDPVLGVRDRSVAVTNEAAGYRRMTLTYPALDAARQIVFVVSGDQKAEALTRVLAGDTSMPAARLQAAEVSVLADAAAASRS